MKIQAICKIEHDGESFLATKKDLRKAIPQVEAVLKAFAILDEVGVSVDEDAEFYITALEGSHSDDPMINFTLRSKDEASEFLAAIKEALGE